jgi:vacuolar protein sorting-associated protein VTA1
MDAPSAPPALPSQPSFPTIPVQPVQQSSARVIPNLDDIEDPVDEDDSYNEEERKSIMQAGKFAKFAQSALLYDDVKTAMENLEKALQLLKPLRQIE